MTFYISFSSETKITPTRIPSRVFCEEKTQFFQPASVGKVLLKHFQGRSVNRTYPLGSTNTMSRVGISQAFLVKYPLKMSCESSFSSCMFFSLNLPASNGTAWMVPYIDIVILIDHQLWSHEFWRPCQDRGQGTAQKSGEKILGKAFRKLTEILEPEKRPL